MNLCFFHLRCLAQPGPIITIEGDIDDSGREIDSSFLKIFCLILSVRKTPPVRIPPKPSRLIEGVAEQLLTDLIQISLDILLTLYDLSGTHFKIPLPHSSPVP